MTSNPRVVTVPSAFAPGAQTAPAAPLPSRKLSASGWHKVDPVVRHLGDLLFFLLLARFLRPADYGLFLLAFGGIAIAESVFVEVAGQILVRSKQSDPDLLSTAFVAITTASGAVTLILYLLAWQVAEMCDSSPFAEMFQSLTVLPLLGGLAVVPRAVLRRRGSCAVVTAATAAGLIAGGTAAMALAIVGAGPWALVAQVVVARFVEVTVSWLAAGEGIGVTWRRTRAVELAKGLDLAAARPAIAAAGTHLPPTLLALLLGPTAAGLWFIGARLFETLSAIGNSPTLPPYQISSAAERRQVIKDIAISNGRIALPTAAGSAALTLALVPLLEPVWWGAIPPAQIVMLAALPSALVGLCGSILVPEGNAAAARLPILQAVTTIGVVLIAAPFGLTPLAWALVAHAALASLVGLATLRSREDDNWPLLRDGFIIPAIAAAVAGVIVAASAESIARSAPPALAFTLLAGQAGAAWLVLIQLLRWLVAGPFAKPSREKE